jgi:ketopantoate reductase
LNRWHAVERGQENAVSTPANAALTALVRQIEAGTRPIDPHNLEHRLS